MSAGMMERRHGIRVSESSLLQRSHRPYASMNWIRFNGSPRCHLGVAISQPLVGTPLVNA